MADNKRGKAAFFSDDDFNVEAQVAVAKEDAEDNNTTNLHNTHTQHTNTIHNVVTQSVYTTQREEMRNKRVQFVIKPSVNEKLDELAKSGAIKSKNDLVNFLLESYIAQLED